MNRCASRRFALLLLVGFLLQLSGVPLVLAANGSVRGRIAVEGGAVPQGAMVKATPLDGGPSILADVGADGSYAFPQLQEGAYLFEVVGADGTPLGPGTPTLVPPGALQLNLRVKPAPKMVEPQDVTSTATPGTTTASGTTREREPKPPLSTGKKWAVWGAIIGGLGVGIAAGGNGDGDGSPSQP